ncbi:MAG: type IV pilus biogenesis/stability protein PilW [Proteobacteria bacterium]|nr:type IV pilus biogenesis/stability protein PilW [Pseudomonadota bacterium]
MKTPPATPAPAARAAGLLAAVLGMLLCACGTTASQETSSKDAARYNVQLGIGYLRQGDIPLAKTKLDRALQQDPDNADVHSARALLFQRMGEQDKADAEFRASLRLAPQNPDMVNNYAVYLCEAGRTDEGVKRFQEAARNALYRTPEAAYTNAGVCLRAAHRDEEARASFIRALQIRPGFAEAAFQLGNLQFQHNELAQARATVDGFIATSGATADLLLLGTRVARAQGDRIGAQHYARRLTLDFPGTDQARAVAAPNPNPG